MPASTGADHPDFRRVPWARALLASPSYTVLPLPPVPTSWEALRQIPPTELVLVNRMFRDTLGPGGAGAVRAAAHLRSRRSKSTSSNDDANATAAAAAGGASQVPAPAYIGPETLLLISLGADGLGGRTSGGRTLHDGLCVFFLDQVAGAAAATVATRNYVTGELDTHFKMTMDGGSSGGDGDGDHNFRRLEVPLPSLLLCRAGPIRMEGRKIWIRASLEDGMGKVFCDADGLFIMLSDARKGEASKI